jgi:multidrug efflux pump subunit AcrB
LYAWSENGFRRIEGFYSGLLGRALVHRWLTIGIGAGAFALGLLALVNVPREFMPMEDRSSFMISFETPQGATLRQTDRFAAEIERILGDMPEVQHQFMAIGLGFGGPGDTNRGMVFVRLVPRRERADHQEQVMQSLRQHLATLPHGRAFVSEGTPGGMGGAPIAVAIQHPDMDELDRQQSLLMQWMEGQPDLFIGVQSNLELNNPQVEVVIDRDRASEMGLSVAEISNTMRYLFGSPPISSVERDAQRYDVITDVFGRGGMSPDILRQVHVRGQANTLVPLDTVVELSETIGPSEIHRLNRLRSATVSSQTPPGVALGVAVDRLEAFLETELPAGASYELTGMSQLFEESFYYLALALVLSIVFIYLVLAAQFESFIHPFTIMLALPLATVGAFGGL